LEGDAIGSGIGERLKKIELPPLWYVLIYPNFEVSTAWVYQNFVLTKSRIRLRIQKFLTTPEKISQILKNDLEKVVSSKYPHIETMKDILCSSGALGSLMTGSGPTVFGLFSEEGGASEAYKKIKEVVKERGWIVVKAHSILA
jgi:4-diphosphocytidyl-2-C-methyl-D-erythritol kinase